MRSVRLLLGERSNNQRTYEPASRCLEPDTQTVGVMLALAAREGWEGVVFGGGEPSLRRDLARLAAAAAGFGLKVSIATNGRIFSYAEAVVLFRKAGVSRCVIQLCGPDAAVHDAVTGSESFAQTVAGLSNAVAGGMDVAVEVPVCSANVGVLLETGLLAATAGATSICFRLVEAGTPENIDIVPDLLVAAEAVAGAVDAIDRTHPGVVCGYADFPCCLLPTLKGRELEGPRNADLIFLDEGRDGFGPGRDVSGRDGTIRVADAGDPFRATPFPCAACELRRGCPTVEESLVAARGAGVLHLPVHSVSDIAFVRAGLLDGPVFRNGKCPWQEGPICDTPPVESLYLVTPAGTELWKLESGDCDRSRLMHAKNIRGNLVLDECGKVPKLDQICTSCENLARCAAVFHAEGDDMADAAACAPVVSSDAGRSDYLKWPDFAAGFAEFLARSGDSRVRFEGHAPEIHLLHPDSPTLRRTTPAVEPVMLWEAVRKAAMCSIEDYSLPYGPSAFSFDVKAADRWAEVDRMGTILIIRKCTMNCIICQVQKFYEGIDIMPLPHVVKFLEEFRLLGYTRLDLFGGEPTMRKDLVDLVFFAHRMGFYTDLITNGTLMDDALAVALRDAGLDLCIVSLDGPTPEIHDKIRRVKDGHQKAVAGIQAAIRAGGMEVNVDTVVLPENIDYLIDLAKQVSRLGVTRINMFLCLEGPISSPVPRLLGFDTTLDYYERILPEMRRIGEASGTGISVGPRLPMAGRTIREVSGTRMFRDVTEGTYNVIYRHPDILCKAPDDEVYISLFGDVFPCTAPQMLESSANMGNAYRRKLIEIVRSDRWNEFRKISGHHEGCRMCWRAHFDLDREGEERVLDAE